jgi:hypothetical protein
MLLDMPNCASMAGNAGPVTAMSSAATNTPKNNTSNSWFRSLSDILPSFDMRKDTD